MAVSTPVELGRTSATNTSTGVNVTLSGAIPTGALAMCEVTLTRTLAGQTLGAPTSVTGGGVTWVLEASNEYDITGTGRGGIYLYRAAATSPSGTTVTMTPSALIGIAQVVVFYVTGAVITDNGNDAFLQAVSASGASVSTISASMATASDTVNNQFLAVGAYNNTATRTFTPNASPALTELFDFSDTLDAIFGGTEVQYATGVATSNPSIGFTLSGSASACGIIVVELDAAPVGPTITVQPTNDVGIISNGQSTVYTATATGTNVQAPTWSEDASPISDGGIYDIVTTGAGTSSCTSTLTITRTVKTGTPFDIKAGFDDDNGSTDTNTVTDTWWTGPVVTTFPATDGDGESTATLTSDYVTGVGEAIEVRIPLSDGDVAVTVTTT
jgi:hypothetical protein